MPDRSRASRQQVGPAIPRRSHIHLIGAVAGVVALGLLLTLFLATQQRDLAVGTPAPATVTLAASPTAVPTQVASPAAEVRYPAGSLPALLQLAPDWIDDDTGLPVQATYADIQGWRDVQGLDPGELDDAGMRAAIAPLAMPETVKTRGMTKAWRDVYGFDLRQVDAVLAVGQAPNLVLIMPGRYDIDALYATWVANGYQAVAVEETTVWSLSPGDRIDLSAPASLPALGLMNTAVVLDDGTLVATSRQSTMAATLRVARGSADSLADRDSLQEAVALPGMAETMSAVLATGMLLESPEHAHDAAPATPEGEQHPPPADLVLFGLLPDDTGTSMAMILVYVDPLDDRAVARSALRQRIGSDPVWSARYRLEHLAVRGDGNLISMRIVSVAGGGVGFEIVDPRELAPFRWSTGK